jgi:hypothetical protein
MTRRGPDLIGQRFGMLTVTARATSSKSSGASRWDCVCDCGGTSTAESARLLSGEKTTCGCRGVGWRPHGHTQGGASPTWRTWKSMLARCENAKAPNYEWYGARGITVCERWHVFANFLEDMGERPPGTSIDRIDGAGNYEPGNCRWATPAQQSQNLSTNKLSADDALVIAARTRAGESARTVAAEFGVHPALARQIRNGSKWANVVGAWRKEQGK